MHYLVFVGLGCCLPAVCFWVSVLFFWGVLFAFDLGDVSVLTFVFIIVVCLLLLFSCLYLCCLILLLLC